VSEQAPATPASTTPTMTDANRALDRLTLYRLTPTALYSPISFAT
jgi:hypothetical protein